MADPSFTIREASDSDLDAIVEVGATALGWDHAEPNEALFRWKHVHNVFGPSPIWLAEIDGRLAGYRALMRWELVDPGGRRLRAVRAVDTATHPEFRRRGIFSTLTSHAVDHARREGVDLVFNTPNEFSRPGYLKLGWIDVGRLPVAVRPTSMGAIGKLVRARVPAAKWSEASTAGQPAQQILDAPDLDELVSGQRAPGGLATALSTELLRWRYSLEPLHYRAWCPDGVRDGVIFFRVRQRGPARECAVGHVLSPNSDPRRASELMRQLSRRVDADYLLQLGSRVGRWFVPIRGNGPKLTARALEGEPPQRVEAWHFSLGDIELF